MRPLHAVSNSLLLGYFVIDNHDGVAYAGGNSIHLSTRHIKNYGNAASALVEFRGVMVHETAHLYQRNGGSSDGAFGTDINSLWNQYQDAI